MADLNNVFSGVKSLADSNSNWIKTSQDLMNGLVEGIKEHLDNIEYVIKNAEKSGCDISDLQNIYSIRLDVYEAIVNCMTKINEVAKTENEIQMKMYNEEYKNYKSTFAFLKTLL